MESLRLIGFQVFFQISCYKIERLVGSKNNPDLLWSIFCQSTVQRAWCVVRSKILFTAGYAYLSSELVCIHKILFVSLDHKISMSTSILNITEDIFVVVFSKWSDITDVVRLDTAICVQRDYFLSLIRGDIFNSFEIKNYGAARMLLVYTWFFLREVKFKNIIIFGDCSSKLLEFLSTWENKMFLSLTLILMRPVHYSDRLLLFINSCSSLTDLIVRHCDVGIENVLVFVKPTIWKVLTTFSVYQMMRNFITARFLVIISDFCQCLNLLDILVVESLDTVLLKRLIKNNPNLTELHLKEVDDNFVEFLSDYCSKLLILSLSVHGVLSTPTLFLVLEKLSVAAIEVIIAFYDENNFEYHFHFSNLSVKTVFSGDLFDEDRAEFRAQFKKLVNFNKPCLELTGNFDFLWERHMVSPLKLLKDVIHVMLVKQVILSDQSLLLLLRANNNELVSLSIDVGASQLYPNLLNLPFLEQFDKLKYIKLKRKFKRTTIILLN